MDGWRVTLENYSDYSSCVARKNVDGGWFEINLASAHGTDQFIRTLSSGMSDLWIRDVRISLLERKYSNFFTSFFYGEPNTLFIVDFTFSTGEIILGHEQILNELSDFDLLALTAKSWKVRRNLDVDLSKCSSETYDGVGMSCEEANRAAVYSINRVEPFSSTINGEITIFLETSELSSAYKFVIEKCLPSILR